MKLAALKNIGLEIQKKLKNVGITDAETLKALGSQEAFFRLKTAYPEVCLVHLYALQGAIEGVAYNKLPEETKNTLKFFNDRLKMVHQSSF